MLRGIGGALHTIDDLPAREILAVNHRGQHRQK
jgi:hypothetical protein